MKNKLLVCACAVGLISVMLTSCKQHTDFDAICDDVSTQTLGGLFSGVEPDVDNLVLSVVQYRFNEDGTAEREVMALGDGVYKTPETTKFASWKLGNYIGNKAERVLLLTPSAGGAPLEVIFTMGGIMHEEQPFAGDKNDKIKDIIPTQDALVGKVWYANDTTWFRVDTTIMVTKYDTVWTTKPKKDENGKIVKDEDGHTVYERTVKSVKETQVEQKTKMNVTPTAINIRKLELNRDANSLTNTGKWDMHLMAFDVDSKTYASTVKQDTTASYEFHWAFSDFSSSSVFIINARQANGNHEFFDIKYDAKIPAITLDKQLLKVLE